MTISGSYENDDDDDDDDDDDELMELLEVFGEAAEFKALQREEPSTASERHSKDVEGVMGRCGEGC